MRVLWDDCALILKNYLIIADLHIGIELEIQEAGFSIKSQIYDFENRISKLIDKCRAEKLLILGDLKHNISAPVLWEKLRIYEFFEYLAEFFDKIIITKGNHDGNLEKVINVDVVEILRELKIGKFLFLHGHANSRKKSKFYIIGHNHPVIELKDKKGTKYRRKVWIFGRNERKEEILVLPAFSNLVGGVAFNRDEELLGPIIRRFPRESFDIFLTNGTYLGKTKDVSDSTFISLR